MLPYIIGSSGAFSFCNSGDLDVDIFGHLFLLSVTSLRELALLLLELEALLLREAEDTDELLPEKLCRAVKYTQSVTRGSDQHTNHKTKRDNCNSHLDE